MAYRLANVEGRAVRVSGEHYFDLEAASGGALGSDPMTALNSLQELAAISARLADLTPTGKLADAKLGAPVPHPPRCSPLASTIAITQSNRSCRFLKYR